MNKNNHIKYNVILIGEGISSLCFLNILKNTKEFSNIKILIIEKKSIEDVYFEDTFPFYFNKIINFKNFEVVPQKLNLRIWENNKEYKICTKSISERFSKKLLNKTSKTTIDFIDGSEKIIYTQYNTDHIDRKKQFITLLKTNLNVHDNISFIYDEPVIHIDQNKKIINTNKNSYQFEHLISTIPLNIFLTLSNNIKYLKLLYSCDFNIYTIRTNENKYEVTYCSDEKIRFSRIAHLGYKIFIESREKLCFNNLNNYEEQLFNNLGISFLINSKNRNFIHTQNNRFINLSKSDHEIICNEFEKNSVYFIGRYANWVYKLTENIYDDSYDIIKKLRN